MSDEKQPIDVAPPGVDPGLWTEFEKVSERVHTLANWDEDQNGPKPPPRRVVVNLPQEWFVLLTWISRRHVQWIDGHKGPTGWTPEFMDELGPNRFAPGVRSILHHLLNEEMQNRLSQLCWRKDYLLRDLPPRQARTPPDPGDYDDEVPF